MNLEDVNDMPMMPSSYEHDQYDMHKKDMSRKHTIKKKGSKEEMFGSVPGRQDRAMLFGCIQILKKEDPQDATEIFIMCYCKKKRIMH